MRRRILLDGEWKFHHDSTGDKTAEAISEWRTIGVPGPWQAQFQHLRNRAGAAWYLRRFDLIDRAKPESMILHFGAVDYLAQVWLNGSYLGDHEGGYLPFAFEVLPHLKWGKKNELLVRVVDPTDDHRRYPDYPFSEIPHGKQSWYGPLSGLWQSVWLERRSSPHLSSVQLRSDLSRGTVRVELHLSGPLEQAGSVCLTIKGQRGDGLVTRRLDLQPGSQVARAEMAVNDPHSWSHWDPYLYTLEATLWRGGDPIDKLRKSFGFRKIEARDGHLYLNGDLLYLRGALDQDYHLERISIPAKEEDFEAQFAQARAMGINCVRCHVKVPDPRYFDAADRAGMLVWAELPSWRHFSRATAERARETLKHMLQRDGHHPSIIAWTILNEGWGVDLVNDASHRQWTAETYRWLKRLDPTRLVVDNSPCDPNFHIQTDVEDYHHYSAMPEHRREWDRFVEEFSKRPAWTFGPYAECSRDGSEPLIVSEFGSWGLPDAGLLIGEDGSEPWWFESGQDWLDGAMYPHGYLQRFQQWGLDRVFGSWQEFVKATQEQQLHALKGQIESLRASESIAGYVITELTDVHWECNGLMDMRRNPKACALSLSTLNADTVILPRWQRTAYWSGEQVVIVPVIAHDGRRSLPRSFLSWRLHGAEAEGRMEVPGLEPGQRRWAGEVTFSAPPASSARQARVHFDLKSREGQLLASNWLDLSVFQPQDGKQGPRIRIWPAEDGLGAYIAAPGNDVITQQHDADILIAHELDDDVAAQVRRGSALLLLPKEPVSLDRWLPGVRVVERRGSVWEGDWASTFSWLRREGPLCRIPGGAMLDHTFEGVAPTLVITGMKAWEFRPRAHAGVVVGWVHKPAATVAEWRLGEGRVVVCTFDLLSDSPGVDPLPVYLLQALVELCGA